MKSLAIKNTLSSLEVAEMLETKHCEILKKLDGAKDRKGIIEILNHHQMSVVDYFIESTYKDAKGEERKCYLLTKMGCEFLANKFTGEKGVIFTANYVKRFNQMEQQILQPKMLTATEQLELQLQAMKEQDKKIDRVDQKIDNLKDNMPLFNIECKELQASVRKLGTKMLGGYHSQAYNDNSLRSRVYADIQKELRRNFGVDKYEAIKRCQLQKANELLSNYTLPIVLEDEIIKANNQISFDKEVV